jgi:hypothetical protein
MTSGKASPGTVEMWVVPGARHTGGLRTQPTESERRVVAFFDRAVMADGTSTEQEVQ